MICKRTAVLACPCFESKTIPQNRADAQFSGTKKAACRKTGRFRILYVILEFSAEHLLVDESCNFSSSRMSSSGPLIHVFHIGAVVLLKCKAHHQCFIHIQHFIRRDFPQISQNLVLIYGAQLLQHTQHGIWMRDTLQYNSVRFVLFFL